MQRDECPRRRTYVRTYVSTCTKRTGKGGEEGGGNARVVVCFATVQKGVAGDDRLCGSSHVRRTTSARGSKYGW